MIIKELFLAFLLLCSSSGIGAEPVSAGAAVFSSVLDLSNSLLSMFDTTCSEDGYKRGNNVNLKNNLLGAKLKARGFYQDSGKIYRHGEYELEFNETTSWYFTKHAGSATGSNGVNLWQILDGRGYTLVIFYENPWSGSNFAGFCIDKIDYNDE